jgi:hypothetical protein
MTFTPSTYRWPEAIRFKHIHPHQCFGLNGHVYARISARRYVPAKMDTDGTVHLQDRPVRAIASVNTPVEMGVFLSDWPQGN